MLLRLAEQLQVPLRERNALLTAAGFAPVFPERQLADPALSFPPRWHYDILRALDYFQAVNAPRDPRLAEAIEIVHNSRLEDGRWPLQHTYRGKTYFELEHLGAPSRWNTLRALRVLRWWHRRPTAPGA